MAKLRPAKSKKSRPRATVLTPEQLERRRRWTRRVVHGAGILAVVGGFTIGYGALGQHVRERYTLISEPPALVLVNRPVWMNDRLAGDVAGRVAAALPREGSTTDHSLLVRLHDILSADAWIERVNAVRRERVAGRDTIMVDCVYRTPLAIARWDNGRELVYGLVSTEGVLLPIRYTSAEVDRILKGEDRSTNLRVITGLAREPPAVGQRWSSERLRSGLDVAALLHEFPAARDVTLIDVANVGSRDAAQVILWTRQGTEIRWGQPPNATDFLVEASPQAKLRHLETVYASFNGHYPRWVDVRFDAVKYLKADRAQEE